MGIETRRVAFLTFSKEPTITVGGSLSIANHQPLGKTGLHSLYSSANLPTGFLSVQILFPQLGMGKT